MKNINPLNVGLLILCLVFPQIIPVVAILGFFYWLKKKAVSRLIDLPAAIKDQFSTSDESQSTTDTLYPTTKDNQPIPNHTSDSYSPEVRRQKRGNESSMLEKELPELAQYLSPSVFQEKFYAAKDKGIEIDPWELPREKAPWELR